MRIGLKKDAHNALWRAIYAKEIPRADSLKCKDCGRRARDYDHAKGYEKRFWLIVEPVCRTCHMHRTNKRKERIHFNGRKSPTWKSGLGAYNDKIKRLKLTALELENVRRYHREYRREWRKRNAI